MKSIPAKSVSALAPAPEYLHNKKSVELSDAAQMLLPGLEHARSVLDTAIRLLATFTNQPPQSAPSNAEAAMKIRKVLAAFGHPPFRR